VCPELRAFAGAVLSVVLCFGYRLPGQSQASRSDSRLQYRLDVEAAVKAGHFRPVMSDAVLLTETLSILRARLDAASMGQVQLEPEPPLGFRVVLSAPEQRERVQRLVETSGRLEKILVASRDREAVERSRAALLEWLARDDHRAQLEKQPSLIAKFAGPTALRIRWVPHRIKPSIMDPKKWGPALARSSAEPWVVPLFGLERLSTAPPSSSETLLELVAVDLSKSYFTGGQIDPTSVHASDADRGTIAYRMSSVFISDYADFTRAAVGCELALILDGMLLCAPRFEAPILDGSCVIRGDFTPEATAELTLWLRTGALLVAPVRRTLAPGGK
jgi:hypothetical protein